MFASSKLLLRNNSNNNIKFVKTLVTKRIGIRFASQANSTTNGFKKNGNVPPPFPPPPSSGDQNGIFTLNNIFLVVASFSLGYLLKEILLESQTPDLLGYGHTEPSKELLLATEHLRKNRDYKQKGSHLSSSIKSTTNSVFNTSVPLSIPPINFFNEKTGETTTVFQIDPTLGENEKHRGILVIVDEFLKESVAPYLKAKNNKINTKEFELLDDGTINFYMENGRPQLPPIKDEIITVKNKFGKISQNGKEMDVYCSILKNSDLAFEMHGVYTIENVGTPNLKNINSTLQQLASIV
jgi:hypothetical protein